MKVTKRQLKRIIREERARLLNESSVGLMPGIGFAGNSINPNPNFARAYHGSYADSPASQAMKRNHRERRVAEVGGLGRMESQLTFGQEIESLRYLFDSKNIDYELDRSGGEFYIVTGEDEGIAIKIVRRGR